MNSSWRTTLNRLILVGTVFSAEAIQRAITVAEDDSVVDDGG
jgi:hypothetical protein